MCGIAGIYNIDGGPPDPADLARMASAIAHRGPDAERFYHDGGLGLAHRHLRIIDLSDAAVQPMPNEDSSVWLVFNGEVYNYVELRPALEALGHRFRSHSDTEVVIHAYEEWGVDCLRRFNGMFAFALWDRPKRRLLLARDRLGVKPLYYRWDGRRLAFASEIKALCAMRGSSVEPELAALAEYMDAMYTTGEKTWFRGVKRLLPGYYMLVDPQGRSVRRWWDLPSDEDEPGARPERYYSREARRILEDSVRLRLRSDVPLGSHLSGGLDSSAVVALLSGRLAGIGEHVRTFSGAFAEGQAYDERRYVREIVARYSTDHREVVPSWTDLDALFDRLVWQMDEPAAGPGILLQWAVCRLSRQSGVTVINGGQGGDEAWGGYFGYVPAYLRTLAIQAKANPRLLSQLLDDGVTLLGRRATRGAAWNALRSGRTSRLAPGRRPGAWAGDRFLDFAPEDSPLSDNEVAGKRTPLSAAMYWDLKWYLPALLQVEDRTSMAFSLESRAPLLDYRLVELSATVPSALRLKGLQMKHVLRRAVRDLLPEDIYNRKDKMGMPTPIAPWFAGPLGDWVERRLLSPDALSAGLLSEEYARQAIAQHRTHARDRSVDLWKMLNLVSWWRIYVEGNLPDAPTIEIPERRTVGAGASEVQQ